MVRGIWWFVSDLLDSCRESSLSEKRESARYCRAHAFPFAEYNELAVDNVDGDHDIFILDI